jgi:hypothetical protein
MRVDKAESTESSAPSAQPSQVGKIEMGGISEDYIANVPVARNQNANLASEFSGNCGEMPG